MRGRSRREPPEEVPFPVTPMLDMAFQLLAFFVLTFQAPSREARIDLHLPSRAAGLPVEADAPPVAGGATAADDDLENDLTIVAEAGPDGRLKSLRLAASTLSGPDALAADLARYRALLDGRPLRVVLVADDALLYDDAARIIAACDSAGASAIRLGPPAEAPR